MAKQPHYAGAALIRVDTASANALEDLGYTEDGAQISIRQYTLDVPGDENGGNEGPPIDVQHLGETAEIRLTMTKWEASVADKIAARLYGGTTGTPGTPGTMMFNESKTYRLVVHTTTTPFNFPRVIFKDAIEINKGTKFSRFVIVATAYKNASGVLYNSTTS